MTQAGTFFESGLCEVNMFLERSWTTSFMKRTILNVHGWSENSNPQGRMFSSQTKKDEEKVDEG